MGKDEDKIRRLAAKRGQLLPDLVADAPELPAHLRAYLRAYNELDTCRKLGFGAVGPIPWTAIDRYAARHGYLGDDFDDLVYVLMRMDDAARRITQETKGKESQGGKPESVLKSHGTHRQQRR